MNDSLQDLFTPDSFVDPRLSPEFEPLHWPLYNSKDAPMIGTQDPHERRCLEFLAAYYQINLANAALLAAPERKEADACASSFIRRVSAGIEFLEALEDRYAAIGFYGEPEVDGLFYRNIILRRPELPKLAPTSREQSSHVAIPDLEALGLDFKGPFTVTRWSHGKMDFQELAEPR